MPSWLDTLEASIRRFINNLRNNPPASYPVVTWEAASDQEYLSWIEAEIARDYRGG